MKVLVKKHSEHAKFEQHGNEVDIAFCGLVSGFNGFVSQQSDGYLIYKKGSIFKVSLGFAAKLPEGYKAQPKARSSTRKNFGVMLTNAIGIIDTNYSGDDDVWFAEFIAVENGAMKLGDRILQFDIVKTESIEIEFVDKLDDVNRGGHGSTGI